MLQEAFMSHKTKKDWLEAGMKILVKSGAPNLTIERLCQNMEMTKGSFYHHFRGQKDYIEALLLYWHEVDTRQIMDGIQSREGTANPLDRILMILGSRSADTARSEIAIRAWGLQNEQVRTQVEKVDQERLLLLMDNFMGMGRERSQAELMAQMLYTMLVGCYSIIPPLETGILMSLYVEFKHAYHID
jgi:AcrR family transcriptional regulator